MLVNQLVFSPVYNHQERSCITESKSTKRLDFILGTRALHFGSERVNEIEICVEEAGGIFQLRVVTDVLVQNGDGRPLDQLPAGTR